MASSLSHCLVAAPPPTSRTPSICPFHKSFNPKAFGTQLVALPRTTTKSSSLQTKATLDDKGQISTSPSVLVPEEKQPTKKKLNRGRYFPITAVQRFDAAGKRIENGVYLGPLGNLTFEGRLSWKKRILAFIFERIRIKIGPLNPFEISFKGEDEREPSNKDPFFIWFYIDEEIAVARGRSGELHFGSVVNALANLSSFVFILLYIFLYRENLLRYMLLLLKFCYEQDAKCRCMKGDFMGLPA
ncbi:UNVERIFIED_CONTAM: hypothetical protein Sangu_0078100 [Sesamum angustifolium]|uniref:Uncharacterized protein n=1 Tax=Sesamum angustifolium TaxID=2727405 RepID=A0AAW2RJW5_9LAMI